MKRPRIIGLLNFRKSPRKHGDGMNQQEISEDVAHPAFSIETVSLLASYGQEMTFNTGDLLFSRDDRDIPLFIIRSGKLEVFEVTSDGETVVVSAISDGQFTGELYLWNNRKSLVSCRSTTESMVIAITRENLTRLLRSEPEIGSTILSATILRHKGLVQSGRAGVVLIGDQRSGSMNRIQRFLVRNSYPHKIVDISRPDEESGQSPVADSSVDVTPMVLFPDGRVLRDPESMCLAQELGLYEEVSSQTYDVAIIGAGPAGLAAAVNAASEGLKTIVIEGNAPGGQAGTSSRIENYLGFPIGLSGQELANRSQIQAQKFGAHLLISREAIEIECKPTFKRLVLHDKSQVLARAVIIATGARYRRLTVPNYDRFEGTGIHYAATAMESALCAGESVAVVGAGNSAGQAALFLSQRASRVHLVFRGRSLDATMSEYLVQRILSSSSICIHPCCEIERLDGDRHLEHVAWRNEVEGSSQTESIRQLFILIGATPNTGWLGDTLALDDKGFICTGPSAGSSLPHATSRAGIFAIGDVRSTSVKRVSAAAGEGSVVVSEVHEHLAMLHQELMGRADHDASVVTPLASRG
jgi:thioredoxin reductase (NADPH)